MTNGSKPAVYELERWEVHSRRLGSILISEAFVWFKTPDERSFARASAKDVSPITALCKAVQEVVSVPVRIVEEVVVGHGEKSPGRVNMVVIVGEPGVVGSATVHSPNILSASVEAFVAAINNAMVARPVVMVA
ncbi:MAG: alpha-isopropylmalate synthase regulatory domain-containing protein [bacterium]|nr:alpha-isopropylmalate synthase regulatory domain-containing protein [bacterium]